MAAFGVISACYTNIAISTVLRSRRGHPEADRAARRCRRGAYLSARVLHAMVVGAILVAITMVFGAVAYDVACPDAAWPLVQFLVTFLVGSPSFAALGARAHPAVPERRRGARPS